MKKNTFLRTVVPAMLASVFYMLLSLACASAPEPKKEPTSEISLENVNQALKNQEVNILSNNGLTSDQLMEVTKLCIQTGELTGVEIIEENAKLSYAVLKATIPLNKKPMAVKFSYSISKTGTLKMRVTEILEQDSVNAPYSVTVYTKDYEATMEAIKATVLNRVESIGNTVLKRSADFA